MPQRIGGIGVPEFEVGEIVAGKFRVEGVLGVGGMGVVFDATHVMLGERVALKCLRDTNDDEIIARFIREARAAARIRSQHVARVLDVGLLESGAPYLVMEHLEGRDLERLLASGAPIPLEDTALYCVQACEGLAAAHELGIIDRDVKPSNLFLTLDADDSPTIKVLDFGVSKETHAGDWSSLTKTRSAMGTPLYMSPEQMRSARDVDVRADIWSVGVVLYRLLTNQLPFDAETLPALVTLLLDPSQVPVNPRDLRPEIPEGLSRIVLQCLERDRARRPASAADLASRLATFAGARGEVHAARARRRLARASRSTVGTASTEPPPIEVVVPPDADPKRDTETAFGRTSRWRSLGSRHILAFALPAALILLAGAALRRVTSTQSTSAQASAIPEPPHPEPVVVVASAVARTAREPIVTPVDPASKKGVPIDDLPIDSTLTIESKTAIAPRVVATPAPVPVRAAPPPVASAPAPQPSASAKVIIRYVDLESPYGGPSLANPYR